MIFKRLKEEYDSYESLKQIWEKRSTIFILELIWAIFILFIFVVKYIDLNFKSIKGIITNYIALRNLVVIYILIALLIFVIWYFKRKVPKIPKDKIGIIFAISTSNLKKKNIIKEDFIRRMKKEIDSISKDRYVIEILSEYRSSLIIEPENESDVLKETNKYLKRSNAKLLIFGIAQERNMAGKEYYNLILNAVISHPNIDKSISVRIGHDMRLALPEETRIPIEDELRGFEIVSSLYGISAKLFIGIADYISQDYRRAIEIHKLVLNESENKPVTSEPEKTVLSNIKNISKKALIGECIELVVSHYSRTGNYEGMSDVLDLAKEIDPQNKWMALSRAIYYFLNGRNIKESLKELEIAKNTKDYTWAYNKAFIEGYVGNLDEAYKLYRMVSKKNTVLDSYIQCEEFIYKIIEEEPDKVQLYYCLGLLMYMSREDMKLAKENFEKFIELAEERKLFNEHVNHSKNYLSKIELIGK
jgi:tetratricopeptide (TPR) repeat protein